MARTTKEKDDQEMIWIAIGSALITGFFLGASAVMIVAAVLISGRNPYKRTDSTK